MGKVVLITGGTRGIGAAICKEFHNAGYTVAANYASNHRIAEKFHKETGVAIFSWDVSDPDACIEGVAAVENELGTIDILVNNAGITRDRMMHKLSAEDWHSVIQTNLSSCFYMSKAVIDGMRKRNYGRIINISSINAQAGQMGQTNYSAAKAGIFGFTKALAREVAAKGITVNAVAPGYIHTDMTGKVPENVMQEIIKQIPVGRLGEPEEIARSVLFLAGDDAGFITGETLSVNGGHHME